MINPFAKVTMSNSPENQDSLREKLKATFDSNNSDKNYNVVKGIVSSVPTVGSLLAGFFDNYIVSPATQRSYKFLETLVQELEQLKSKIESVDFESPVFLTTFLHASQIAVRSHKEQKLEALRNVVLNSSIPSSLEDDILAMFLNWIDDFTALHISTLKHLHYLDTYAPNELHKYFPMLEQNRAVYNHVLTDLADRGLIILIEHYITEENEDNAYFKMKTYKLREDIDVFLDVNYLFPQTSKTTELGKQFIKFIENPSMETEFM